MNTNVDDELSTTPPTIMSSLVTTNIEKTVNYPPNTLKKTTDKMKTKSKGSGKWGTKFSKQLQAFQVRTPAGEICSQTFVSKEEAKHFKERDKAENVSASTSSESEEVGLHDDGFGGIVLRKPTVSLEERFKHKKPRKKLPNPGAALYETQVQNAIDPNHPACMSYHDLLQRAHKTLEEKFPNLKKKKKLKCPPPILRAYNGNKRAMFVNASQICRLLNRPISHLEQFLAEELAMTTFHVDETNKKKQDQFSGVLVLKYRMNKQAEGNISKVLLKYINKFVRCSACGGFSSDMRYDSKLRSHISCCKDCHAEKFLEDIKRSFRMTTKADKIAARIKASYMAR